MRTKIKRTTVMVAATAIAGLLLLPVAAVAAGPGAGGGGGGGGGGKPGGGEETTANSLSVPAVFVGSNPFGLTCNGLPKPPDGQTPKTGYTLPGFYYVQGVNTWQAGCTEGASEATATAAWGDNLTGDAKKTVGSPIRVELGLFDVNVSPMTGWVVLKLEPAQLDRLSPYGTLATPDGADGYVSAPQTNLATRVWAPGTLKVYLKGTPGSPVVNLAATAEVNATGKVVFGYNLRVTAPGTYVIEYSFPAVAITSVPEPSTISTDGHTVALEIIVTGSGGGGGGGRPR